MTTKFSPQHHAVLVETVKKERKLHKFDDNFKFNPTPQSLAKNIIPEKPNNVNPLAKKDLTEEMEAEDDAFVESMKRRDTQPSNPTYQTVNRAYGLDTSPLLSNNPRFHHGNKQSEMSKFQHNALSTTKLLGRDH